MIKNKSIKHPHISERKFKEILKYFCRDLPALKRNTGNKYYIKFRERIVKVCNMDFPFAVEIEVG